MNEQEIVLFGLKDQDGKEWKIILPCREGNWIRVDPVYRKTPKGKAEILKFYYEWKRINAENNISFDSFIMSCED